VRRGISEKDLMEGIKIAGAASFLAEIIEPDVQALVY
jgi:predicted peroxiredoxin